SYSVTGRLRSIAVADFDGDGKPDLAVSSDSGSTFAMLRNRGDGTFQSPIYTTVGSSQRQIVAGDFDRDGHPDVAVVLYGGGPSRVAVLRNRGTGTFEAPVYYSVAWYDASLVAVDLDGDGDIDLATESYIFFNRGDGTFAVHIPSGAGSPSRVVAADFDGDGDVDLLSAEYYWYVNVHLRRNQGL